MKKNKQVIQIPDVTHSVLVLLPHSVCLLVLFPVPGSAHSIDYDISHFP
jgi:hypothetical protein